jgi:hypothetical protein
MLSPALVPGGYLSPALVPIPELSSQTFNRNTDQSVAFVLPPAPAEFISDMFKMIVFDSFTIF